MRRAGLSMFEARSHSGRAVVVVDVGVFVAVAVAGVTTVGHGHDLQRLSWDHRTGHTA